MDDFDVETRQPRGDPGFVQMGFFHGSLHAAQYIRSGGAMPGTGHPVAAGKEVAAPHIIFL